MTSAIRDYTVLLGAWVALQFAWQGCFIAFSLCLTDVVLRRCGSTIRYRAFLAHQMALALAPPATVLLAHGAVMFTPSAEGEPSERQGLVLAGFHALQSALPWLFVAWGAGVVVGLIVLLGALLHARRLLDPRARRPDRTGLVEDTARRLGLAGAPFLVDADVGSPCIVGVRRPHLVLPRWIEERLSKDELSAVLAHELTHVQRSDARSHLLQTALAVLLWPHPGTWMVWSALRQEREARCDETAVRLCGSARPLARALFRLSRGASGARLVVPSLGRPLERRFRRLLADPRDPGRLLSGAVPAFGVLAVTLVTVLLASVLPTDPEVRPALMRSAFSPTLSIHAHDPAGTFDVRVRRGRVLGVSIGEDAVPPARIVQRGSLVRILDPAGRPMLDLRVLARGGIAWSPRAAASAS